jgi:hypothetical protein
MRANHIINLYAEIVSGGEKLLTPATPSGASGTSQQTRVLLNATPEGVNLVGHMHPFLHILIPGKPAFGGIKTEESNENSLSHTQLPSELSSQIAATRGLPDSTKPTLPP